MQEFEGRTAVVTGGASGIGLAMANRFADARMNVVLADIEEDALARAVTELTERQARVIGVPTNTMREESVRELADAATSEFGNVHILCNNAGVISTAARGAIWEVPASDWDWVLGVNFYGVLYGLQAFVPAMLEHGEAGHIVNTASLAGLMPGGGSYGVSKHGVLSLTESLYNDLKARNAAISASVLCPGFVNTRIFDAERNRPDELAVDRGPPTDLETAGRSLISEGMAPDDVAAVVFESIEANRFYVLPHPAWDEVVRGRVEHVLDREEPLGIDLSSLLLRRAEGDEV